MARSSRDQCDMGKPRSAGLVVASTTTLCRSSGGKRPRSAATRQVDQALKPLDSKACSPLANRVGIASKFLGNRVIGWTAELGTVEDEAAAKSSSLWRGMSMGDLFELLLFFTGEAND